LLRPFRGSSVAKFHKNRSPTITNQGRSGLRPLRQAPFSNERAKAASCRLYRFIPEGQVRTGLAAGASGIRTLGPPSGRHFSSPPFERSGLRPSAREELDPAEKERPFRSMLQGFCTPSTRQRAAELALSGRSDAFWGDPVCRGRVELRQSTDTLENSRALQSDELACADGTS
jgi:hypothetical protein